MGPRILIVGAGAVGGYFGGRMALAGHDVTFLVRPGRLAQLRADGLRLVSPLGDAALAPRAITADEIDGPHDVILLSVKAYSLAAAMDDFAAAVGPDTRIIPLLNGMRHLDVLAERFGDPKILGGTCLIVSKLDAAGQVVHMGALPKLTFGERRGGDASAIRDLKEALSSPGFETVSSGRIIQDMWNKWVLLASLGAVCCLMRATVAEVAAAPGGDEFARAAIAECASIAAASGHPLAEGTLEGIVRLLTSRETPLTSSMFRDLSQGAPVEAAQIIGDMVQRGRAHQIATPILDLTNLNLNVYERHARPA
ncbi:2-dehydropantoate 2-reductase [Gluconacetobacter sacchari DSM 12717]|uniref:2-dehydropantoate 2-reductase n=2 Tax=Gluconacetobacter sacchari TaxID=92759 RepID=A0A7W4NS99_9PROT|nr:ketopantoate reductase family protein [Gluconacetobacter sacchari]MBB2161878.1 ketopantoate reductase family protein [Gluconacetobacter sacchari]GBQ22253.1 2-dehydropantoate 2-reductase [Gluconacetobacter sacchari DSM 12717]